MVCFYVLAVLPGLITAAIANHCPSVGNLKFFELEITEIPEILVKSKCHDKQYRNLAKRVLREYTAGGQVREGTLMKIAKAYKETSDRRNEALEHLQQQLNDAKFEAFINKALADLKQVSVSHDSRSLWESLQHLLKKGRWDGVMAYICIENKTRMICVLCRGTCA